MLSHTWIKCWFLYSAFSNINQSAVHFIPLPVEYVSCLTMSKAYSYPWTMLIWLYSWQLPNIPQVDKAIETKYLAQGHKHIDGSGARTHSLVIGSSALFHWTTCAHLHLTLSTRVSSAEDRRQVKISNFFKHFRNSVHWHICMQHEKHIQMITNKPSISPGNCETAVWSLR